VERPRVSIDEWMNALEPGDAWLRVAPIDGRWRQERVRVAMPKTPRTGTVTTLRKYSRNHVQEGARVVSEGGDVGERAAARDMPRMPRALPAVPPNCADELVERMGEDIAAKVTRLWPVRHHALGPCLVWTGAKGPDAQLGPYGRMYDAALKDMDLVHRVVWRRVFGPIPLGPNGKPLEVDHKCNVALCQRPDYLQLLTKADNIKRRGATRGANKRQA
jgi:hypothetical protein